MVSNTSLVDTAPLKIRLSGPSIQNYFPLKDAVDILAAVEALVRNSYVALLEEMDVPSSQAEKSIEILGGFPEKGSIIFPIDIQLSLHTVQALAPGLSQITPLQVAEVAKQAMEFWKKISALLTPKDKPPSFSVSVQGNNNTIIIHNANETVTSTRPAALAMAKSYSELKKIPRHLHKEGIETLSWESPKQPTLRMDASSKEKLLHFPKELRNDILTRARKHHANQLIGFSPSYLSSSQTTEPIDASGEIVSFHKENRSGIIKLSGAQNFPFGEYPFEIRSREQTESYILAMLKSRVHIRFIPEKYSKKKTLLNVIWIEKELGNGND